MSKYQIISKKTMRKKDFMSLKNKKNGYLQFFAAKVEEHLHEKLYRTPRGWFLRFFENRERQQGEVSVTTAQQWLDECGINYNLGW
jgi:hypothetical protein